MPPDSVGIFNTAQVAAGIGGFVFSHLGFLSNFFVLINIFFITLDLEIFMWRFPAYNFDVFIKAGNIL